MYKKGTFLILSIIVGTSAFAQLWQRHVPLNGVFDVHPFYDTSLIVIGLENNVTSFGYFQKILDNGTYGWRRLIKTKYAGGFVSMSKHKDGLIVTGEGCKNDTTCGVVLCKLDYCLDEIWSKTIPNFNSTIKARKVYSLSSGNILIKASFDGRLGDGFLLFDTEGNLLWNKPLEMDFNRKDGNIVIDEKADEISVCGSKYLPITADSSILGLKGIWATLSLSSGAIKNYYALWAKDSTKFSVIRTVYKLNDTFTYLGVVDRSKFDGVIHNYTVDERGIVQKDEIIGDTSKGHDIEGYVELQNKKILTIVNTGEKMTKDVLYATFTKREKNFEIIKELQYTTNSDSVFGVGQTFTDAKGDVFIYGDLRINNNPLTYLYLKKFTPDLEEAYFYNGQRNYDYKCQGSISTDTLFLDPEIINIQIDSSGIPPLKEFILSNKTLTPNYPKLKIYPNPATKNIIIELTENKSSSITYSIYNTIGQVLAQQTLSATLSMDIDVSCLKQGIYFIEILLPTEKIVIRNKIIKK